VNTVHKVYVFAFNGKHQYLYQSIPFITQTQSELVQVLKEHLQYGIDSFKTPICIVLSAIYIGCLNPPFDEIYLRSAVLQETSN
jgi:hypothetical protein